MRRIVSVWFPHWQTDAWWWRQRTAERGTCGTVSNDCGARGRPFALIERTKGGVRLAAVDPAAAAEGLSPGMTLADARAALPDLAVADANPTAENNSLGRLAGWCGRWTPWTATDGTDGLVLDVSGCAHLFGGEAPLLEQIRCRLHDFGFSVRAALADTPAAAWAWARFGGGGMLAAGSQATALASLPVAALRLPAILVHSLEQLDLATIADIAALPRAPLARRFGDTPLRRLDQAMGRLAEPIGPQPPATDWSLCRTFAEPIGRTEDVAAGLQMLLRELTSGLAKANRGVRRLAFTIYRVDGTTQGWSIGTARPSRSCEHLARLCIEPLQRLDAGFGIEALRLAATETEPLSLTQIDWEKEDATAEAFTHLIDRIQQRFGTDRIFRLAPVGSHRPERAVASIAALSPARRAGWATPLPRPVRLLPVPEPITVTAPVPDDPPVAFRWRGVYRRVVCAEGPERIAAEWWQAATEAPARDYYWVEDDTGRRYWLFRDGAYVAGYPARWYLHGLFA